MINSGA
jgi:hypothetical protein